jgi:hypothetical protein
MTCDDDNATTERWAPFSLPDEFNNAAAKWMPACVLVLRGGRGGGGEGQDGDVFLHMLIVQLGSQSFFWQHNVGGSTHNNSY